MRAAQRWMSANPYPPLAMKLRDIIQPSKRDIHLIEIKYSE
jgi:hypothetical protein